MTDRAKLLELAERVEKATDVMGGARRTETPDYAQIDSDCFMMMCMKPDEMMNLFVALPEIAAALRAAAGGEG